MPNSWRRFTLFRHSSRSIFEMLCGRSVLLCLLLPLACAANVAAQPQPVADPPPAARSAAKQAVSSFNVVLDPETITEPYTGRVYVVFSKGGRLEPRRTLSDWFSPPQVLAVDVVGAAPGTSINIGATPLAFPKTMNEIPAGDYVVQAIVRRSLDSAVPGAGPGDAFSQSKKISWRSPGEAGAAAGESADLRIIKSVPVAPFRESDKVKLVEITSLRSQRFTAGR